MKYLKLYEEYTDIKADDYYQALSMQEFDELVFDEFLEPRNTLLEFNEMEINQIKKLVFDQFKSKSTHYNIRLDLKNRSFLKPEVFVTVGGASTYKQDPIGSEIVLLSFELTNEFNDECDFDESLLIYKLSDEWYMVSIYGYGNFKCDQIEGLYKLLNDYINLLK